MLASVVHSITARTQNKSQSLSRKNDREIFLHIAEKTSEMIYIHYKRNSYDRTENTP